MDCKKIIATFVFGLLICSFTTAQTQSVKSNKKSETTVENEYMTSIEAAVITELANSDSYDNKLVAIKEIEDIINNGHSSPAITAALNSLACEGTITQERTNGRVTNNYPDIRAKACDLLGNVKTEESVMSLMSITLNDNEPMVAAAAIRALGNIGMEKNDEVVKTIAWTQRRTAVLNPSSSLAYEVIDAYDKLSGEVEDISSMLESLTSIAANPRYVTPVRTKALDLLKKLRTSQD